MESILDLHSAGQTVAVCALFFLMWLNVFLHNPHRLHQLHVLELVSFLAFVLLCPVS